MFNRKQWISLLAADIYATLLADRRFAMEALEAEASGEIRITREIANVIADRLEDFPLEEMASIWCKITEQKMTGAIRRFRNSSVWLHVVTDNEIRKGTKQYWKSARMNHANAPKTSRGPAKFLLKPFQYRHNKIWPSLRLAISEYRIAIGHYELMSGLNDDEVKALIEDDPLAVQRVLESKLSIATLKRTRDAYRRGGRKK